MGLLRPLPKRHLPANPLNTGIFFSYLDPNIRAGSENEQIGATDIIRMERVCQAGSLLVPICFWGSIYRRAGHVQRGGDAGEDLFGGEQRSAVGAEFQYAARRVATF
jgi:hypothetical protein